MNKRPLHTAMILLAACCLALIPRPAMADPAYVVTDSSLCSSISITNCYTDVNRAISDAMAGTGTTIIDSIKIYPGTYTMSSPTPAITKGISISGTSTAGTILNGGGGTSILQISSPSSAVTIGNLTFYNALVGIDIRSASSSVLIRNSVFELGTNNTAINTSNSASTNINNNVFYLNALGIVSDTTSLSSITNNIFVQASGATAISSNIGLGSIYNNLFFGGLIGPAVNVTPGTTGYQGNLQNQDPLFVDPANATIENRDFHLQGGSPCIDSGAASVGNDSVGNPAPDMGAYGGLSADTVPNTVIVSSATSSSSTISLAWDANLDYNVQGYKIYYGVTSRTSTTTPYTGTNATQGASPIDVGKVTSFVLTGLTATVTTPTIPTLYEPIPVNGGLVLNWYPVNNATSYNIYYHLASSTTTEFVIHGIIGTSYTLRGLTNGEWYAIQVTAVNQATEYLAVTAYYSAAGDPGKSMESAYSVEQPMDLGGATESTRSGEVQGLPEATVAYPDLPNSGCFIATAAYNSPDAAPVMVFRRFRDLYLLGNAPGRAFISWYYRTSPEWASRLNSHPLFKPLVRLALAPLLAFAYLSNAMSPVVALALMVLLVASAALAVRRFRKTGKQNLQRS